MTTHLNGLPGDRLAAHGMIERSIDATETDKIITIQFGSDLIKNIIRNGVQTPCAISHPSSASICIRRNTR